MSSPDLLIIGGAQDPSISVLAKIAHEKAYNAQTVLFGENLEPSFFWDPSKDTLLIDNKEVNPKAVFLRQDVFSYQKQAQRKNLDKSMAWHAAFSGYYIPNKNVRIFNRAMDWRTSNKPVMLGLAKKNSLSIPETIISNSEKEIISFHKKSPRVAKPVAGGAYCLTLEEILKNPPWKNSIAPAPAIIQNHLDYPEYRIYLIGKELITFEISSKSIDYRSDRNSQIRLIDNSILPAHVYTGLCSLCEEVGVNFGAADFKTNRKTQETCFLELNNQPMFAAHDIVCNGKISKAIIEALISEDQKNYFKIL